MRRGLPFDELDDLKNKSTGLNIEISGVNSTDLKLLIVNIYKAPLGILKTFLTN